jgi:spermidine/putrescine transport system substrate-binding protein
MHPDMLSGCDMEENLDMTKINDTMATLGAAQMSRRSIMKSALALGAVGLAGPLTVKNAFASSGELNFVGWSGYDDLKKKVMPDFEKASGIKVNFKELPDQDTMFAEAKLSLATGAIDVIEPTLDRLPAWVSNGLIQGWDTNKLALGNYLKGVPGGTAGDAGEVDGKRYFVPSVWGTEAITYNKDVVKGGYGDISLADLYDDKYVGKVTVRGHSSIAAMGRVLDSQGKLPMPWIDGYKNEANMVKLWDIALAECVKHKKNIAQFWSGENEAQAAFKTNGAEIGLTWDSTGFNLRNDGFGYIAPKEGAFAWSQGFFLLANAKNSDQAHEFAKWISTAEGSAAWASAFSSNPVGNGGVELMSPDVAKFYASSFPGDALSKLYWWPAQAAWFLKLRGAYADKWKAA